MFTKNTVFVLGAGVSVPFGIPSGGKLLQILTGSADSTESDYNDVLMQHQILLEVLKKTSRDTQEVDDFVTALKNSGTPSIDTWLSYHKRHLNLGKLAIAAVIANAEEKSISAMFIRDDWYKWLFQNMLKDIISLKDLAKGNRVNFITFNYDRMLEQKLSMYIQFHFGEEDPSLKQAVIEHFHNQIFHVHGYLGLKQNDAGSGFGGLAFHHALNQLGQERTDVIIDLAIKARELSESILIIGEKPYERQLTMRIRNSILEAENIIFLGFGYDERNLAALWINEKLDALEARRSLTGTDYSHSIIGTAVGLGTAQRRDVEAEFRGHVILGEKTLSCVPFCNEFVSVRRTTGKKVN